MMPRTSITKEARAKGWKFVERRLANESDDIKLLFWLICYGCSSINGVTNKTPELIPLASTTLKNFDFSSDGGRIAHRRNFTKFVFKRSRYDEKDFSKQLKERGLSDRYNGFKKLGINGIGYDTLKIGFCISALQNERSLKQHITQFLIEFPDHSPWSQSHKYVTEIIEQLLPKKIVEPDNRNFVWRDGTSTFEKKEATHRLINPNDREHLSLNNIASILTYSNRLTNFIGRTDQLAELEDWLNNSPSRSVMYLYGQGGFGKTRLAAHFAEKAVELGWAAGFLEAFSHGVWQTGDKGCLFIIDHPEQYPEKVESFIRAFHKCDDGRKQVKLILIARNYDFLEALVADFNNLKKASIKLNPFVSNEELGTLFYDAWSGLHELSGQSSQKLLPVSSCEIRHWLEKAPEISRTPLIIIALAYYLFTEPRLKQSGGLELSSPEIIRYISEREIALISREVNRHIKANPHLANDIEVEGTCLLKAMAAVTSGLKVDEIRLIGSELGSQGSDFCHPPTYKRLSYLSLLVKNILEPVRPDILAADFLSLCLEKFAQGQEADWLLSSTGIHWLKSSHTDSATVLRKFVNLNRLISDIDVKLNQRWLNEQLCDRIRTNAFYCDWLIEHLAMTTLDQNSALWCITALRTRLEQNIEPVKKGQLLSLLAYFEFEVENIANAKKAANEALSILVKQKELGISYTQFDAYYWNAWFIDQDIMPTAYLNGQINRGQFVIDFVAHGVHLNMKFGLKGSELMLQKDYQDALRHFREAENILSSLLDFRYRYIRSAYAGYISHMALEIMRVINGSNECLKHYAKKELDKLVMLADKLFSYISRRRNIIVKDVIVQGAPANVCYERTNQDTERETGEETLCEDDLSETEKILNECKTLRALPFIYHQLGSL